MFSTLLHQTPARFLAQALEKIQLLMESLGPPPDQLTIPNPTRPHTPFCPVVRNTR